METSHLTRAFFGKIESSSARTILSMVIYLKQLIWWLKHPINVESRSQTKRAQNSLFFWQIFWICFGIHFTVKSHKTKGKAFHEISILKTEISFTLMTTKHCFLFGRVKQFLDTFVRDWGEQHLNCGVPPTFAYPWGRAISISP